MQVLLNQLSQSQDTLIPALQSSGLEEKALTSYKSLFSKITFEKSHCSSSALYLLELKEQSTEKG